jgi:hypothetical protein
MMGWRRATELLTTLALAGLGMLAVGCGPAPGYEPEPRMPTGYVETPAPEPLTGEELAEQSSEASGQANDEIAVGADPDEYADTDPSALTEFRPALEGHGAWVEDATYGTLWVPSEAEVGTDFVPYTTAGHWTYDDSTSWVWVSDYSWGWAPFHYGRWVHVSRHGWAWIPGRTYAGAWVDWRTGSGYEYVGWAPAAPGWYWSSGFALGWMWGHSPYYSYCHRHHLYAPGLSAHVVRGEGAREHEGHTQPYAGPTGVSGGRVAAAPTVGGGRVVAAPTVGGGRSLATPRVGPRPVELGIKADSVVAPPGEHAGLSRARLLAVPRTAVVQGAAPPSEGRARSSVDGVASAPAYRGPAAGRLEAAASAPRYQGVPPRQAAVPDLRPTPRSFSTSPGVGAPPAAYRSQSGFSTTEPSYRAPSQPSFSTATPSYRAPSPSSPPAYRAQPSYRAPTPSSPSYRAPTPSYRAPTPSYRAPTPSVAASPPSFRSSPSVSSPAVRSAPAARPSTPSRSGGKGRR